MSLEITIEYPEEKKESEDELVEAIVKLQKDIDELCNKRAEQEDIDKLIAELEKKREKLKKLGNVS